MTLQLLHEEFPCICGKFDFLFFSAGSFAKKYSCNVHMYVPAVISIPSYVALKR
jgi:hypothetical protein